MFTLLALPDAQLAISVRAIEQVENWIGHNISELPIPPGQWSNGERSAVVEIKDDELPRVGGVQDVPPLRGEAEPRGEERKRRERRGRRGRRHLLLEPLQLRDVPGAAHDPVLLERDVGVVARDGGEEEAPEAERAEVAVVEGVAADAGEVLGRGVEHPEHARVAAGLPDAEQRGPVDGGEEPPGGVVDPAEVLDAAAGAGGDAAGLVEGEQVQHGARAGVPDGDAAVAVSGGEAERAVVVVVGVKGGEGGGRGRPADGGDEGGERGGGGGGHGEDAEELHGARVGDDDAAAGAVREEARGAEVDAAAVAAARGAREHRRRGVAAAGRIAARSRRRGGGRRGHHRARLAGLGRFSLSLLSDLVTEHHLRLGFEN